MLWTRLGTARKYSPFIGQFIQVDSLLFVDGMNYYQYARNNPITYIDPYGKAWFLLFALAGGGTVAVSDGAGLYLGLAGLFGLGALLMNGITPTANIPYTGAGSSSNNWNNNNCKDCSCAAYRRAHPEECNVQDCSNPTYRALHPRECDPNDDCQINNKGQGASGSKLNIKG